MQPVLILLLLAAPCRGNMPRPLLPGEPKETNYCQQAFDRELQRSRTRHATTMRLLRQRTALLLGIVRHQESIIRSLETQIR